MLRKKQEVIMLDPVCFCRYNECNRGGVPMVHARTYSFRGLECIDYPKGERCQWFIVKGSFACF